MRIGHGFDAHRFASGRPLILGGVSIPHEQGLEAHSDGDVLIHALCDALLGAAALGDIGAHFPDSSENYAGIDSHPPDRHVVGRSSPWSSRPCHRRDRRPRRRAPGTRGPAPLSPTRACPPLLAAGSAVAGGPPVPRRSGSGRTGVPRHHRALPPSSPPDTPVRHGHRDRLAEGLPGHLGRLRRARRRHPSGGAAGRPRRLHPLDRVHPLGCTRAMGSLVTGRPRRTLLHPHLA